MRKIFIFMIIVIISSNLLSNEQVEYLFLYNVKKVISPVKFIMNDMEKDYVIEISGLYVPSWAKKKRFYKNIHKKLKKQSVFQFSNCEIRKYKIVCYDMMLGVDSYRQYLLKKKLAREFSK